MRLNRRYLVTTLFLVFPLLSCSDTTTPTSAADAVGQLLDGNQQSGTVGQALPNPLRVRVTDPQRHPVPAMTVVFMVTSGSGALSSSTVTTDLNGEASSVWTLGPSTAVAQQVSARLVRSVTDTVSIGTFVATPMPGPAQIAAVAGNGQMAAPSAMLPDSLLVRIADQYGNPVSNTPVTWAVTSGGGSLSRLVDTSNAAGYVSVRWTLGSSIGTNTVTAAIANLTPVVFTASSGLSQDIVISSISPSANTLVGSTIPIVVTLNSRYLLSSVSAEIGSQHVALTSPSPLAQTRWTGTLSLTGVPPGPIQLLISATDANNTTVLQSVPLVYAPPPVLTVNTPDNNTVVGSSAVVNASCVDPNGPCTQVTVAVSGQVLASGTTSVNATISLAGYVGDTVALIFTATAANHQTASTIRTVYVYADGHFSVVADVPGAVQDFDGTRILFVDSTNTLRIRTIGGDDVSAFFSSTGVPTGMLTPAGAVFEVLNFLGNADNNLYEYANGATNVIGDIRDHPWYVNGSYLAWVNLSNTLMLRDFTNGTNTPIAITPAGSGLFGLDVSPNGDVAYGIPENGIVDIKLVPKGGTTIAVTNGVWSQNPRTDGTTVVYEKGNNQAQMASWSAADGEVLLGSPIQNATFNSTAYSVNNGWLVYPANGSTLFTYQVWSVSPTKVVQQVSKFTIGGFTEALGANGEVVFVSGSYMYLSLPPYSTSTLLGPADIPKVIWRNGHLYSLVGRSVVMVQ